MRWLNRTRVKYALAGVGVVYLCLFVGYLAYAGVNRAQHRGPSELEAHPERQAEIDAQQRAAEMKERLKLSDEQTQQIAEIMKQNQPAEGDPRERWRASREAIAQVLTPEQQAQMEQSRGQFRGRGGFRGRMSPERMEEFKQKMTPEQQQRFEAELQKSEQHRGARQRPEGQDRGQGRPQR